MKYFRLHYEISETTPGSGITHQRILAIQAILNRHCTWTHEHLGFAPKRSSRFSPWFLSGSTFVGDDLWDAHLVVAFLRYVSKAHSRLVFELRDDGGFVLPGAVRITDGRVELHREQLQPGRLRNPGSARDTLATASTVRADEGSEEHPFFLEGSLSDYAGVREIRKLELERGMEDLQSMSLEKVAEIVVNHLAST